MDKYISFLYDNVVVQKLKANGFMDMAPCSQDTVRVIQGWWGKCIDGFSAQCNLSRNCSYWHSAFTYIMSCKYADSLFDEHTQQINQLIIENQQLKKLVQQLLDKPVIEVPSVDDVIVEVPSVDDNDIEFSVKVPSTISDVDDEDVVNEPLLAAERRMRKNNPVSRAVQQFKKTYSSLREDIIARDWVA
jgi:hypothetical protein